MLHSFNCGVGSAGGWRWRTPYRVATALMSGSVLPRSIAALEAVAQRRHQVDHLAVIVRDALRLDHMALLLLLDRVAQGVFVAIDEPGRVELAGREPVQSLAQVEALAGAGQSTGSLQPG